MKKHSALLLLLLTLGVFDSFSQTTPSVGSNRDSGFVRVQYVNDVVIQDNEKFTIELDKNESITFQTSFTLARELHDHTVCRSLYSGSENVQILGERLLYDFDTKKHHGSPEIFKKGDLMVDKSYQGTDLGTFSVAQSAWSSGSEPPADCSHQEYPSEWIGAERGFLVFKYGLDTNNLQYGWIEISNPENKKLLLHSYGFESDSTLDTVLQGTATTVQPAEFGSPEILPILSKSSLRFEHLSQGDEVPFKLYNISGVLITQSVYRGAPLPVETQGGIYIIEYHSQGGNVPQAKLLYYHD